MPDVPRSRRLRRLVLWLAPLLALLGVEAVLRLVVLVDGSPLLLTMPGARTVYDDCATLPELLAAANYDAEPGAVHGDVRLNSRALRTHEYAVDKPPGARRIVVLGDSHSYTSGNVPTPLLWDRRVAATLAERLPHPVEIINLAVPAVNPSFEWRMWQLEGRRLSPDLVVMAVSVSNDFQEMSNSLADRTWLDRWARHSLCARFVRNLGIVLGAESRGVEDTHVDDAVAAGWGEAVPVEHHPYRRDRPTLGRRTHERIVYARMTISDARRTERFREALADFTGVVRALRDDVRRAGAELVLLLVPAEHQVDDELFARVAAANDRAPEDFDRDRAQRELRVELEALGVAYVDPLPAIREAARATPMYRPQNTHLNDYGQGLLADALSAWLLSDACTALR